MNPTTVRATSGTPLGRYIFRRRKRSSFRSAPNELSEAYLSLLMHLNDKLKQLAVVCSVPYNNVGSATKEVVTVLHTPDELIGGAVKCPLSAKKVALCMNRMGFEGRRTHAARGWNVIVFTGNDIKEAQRLNAHRSATE